MRYTGQMCARTLGRFPPNQYGFGNFLRHTAVFACVYIQHTAYYIWLNMYVLLIKFVILKTAYDLLTITTHSVPRYISAVDALPLFDYCPMLKQKSTIL